MRPVTGITGGVTGFHGNASFRFPRELIMPRPKCILKVKSFYGSPVCALHEISLQRLFPFFFFFFFTSSLIAKYFYTTNVLSCLLEKYYKKWTFHAYLLTQIFESFFFPFLLYVSLQHENSKFIQFSFFCHDFQFR